VTRTILRSDLISLAVMAFAGGVSSMTAVFYLMSGNTFGVAAFVVSAAMLISAAVIFGRRSLNRIDPAN
jgi:succinate-acetate transporter protein